MGGSSTRRVHAHISLRTMLLLVAVAVGAWLVLRLLPVILVLILALFLIGTLNPLVGALAKRGVPRSWAVGLVFFGILAVFVLLGLLTFPPLVAQVRTLVEKAPELQKSLADRLAGSGIGAGLADGVRNAKGGELLQTGMKQALAYSPRFIEIIAYGAASVFIALYLMLDRYRMRGAAYAVVPRRYHLRLARVTQNLEVIVGGYIRGQAITSALMAVFVFGLLTACRIENAIAFAAIAGLTDVLPFVGFLFLIGPAGIASLSHGPVITIIVLVSLAAYQEFENRVIVPRVYGRVLRLPSTVVLLALLAGGQLMGILGALLALPVASALMMFVKELRLALPGERIDDRALRERDEAAEREYEERAGHLAAREAAAIAMQIGDRRRREEEERPGRAAEVPITGGSIPRL